MKRLGEVRMLLLQLLETGVCHPVEQRGPVVRRRDPEALERLLENLRRAGLE